MINKLKQERSLMITTVTRQEIDEILYQAMAAIYQFDRLKVLLFDMTYQDSYLLYFLRKRVSACMSEIAQELNIHISTASREVDRLEKRKLVSRCKDPQDKRNVLVSLEPAGEMLMKASEDHTYYALQRGLKKFSDDELKAIIKGAANMHEILGMQPLNSTSMRLANGKTRSPRKQKGKSGVFLVNSLKKE